MATKVWYVPREGKQVPRFPGQSREMFPPHGGWTTLEGYIQRLLMRGDGSLDPNGREDEDAAYFAKLAADQEAAEQAAADRAAGQQVANTAALAPAERVEAAKAKLGYNTSKSSPSTKAMPMPSPAPETNASAKTDQGSANVKANS